MYFSIIDVGKKPAIDISTVCAFIKGLQVNKNNYCSFFFLNVSILE